MLLFLEVNVIGTLRASGYTRGELIRHYMVMPMLVIAALMKKKENRAEDKTETADVEEMPEEKAEEEAPVLMDTGEKTVYVKADAKGNVKEVALETLMKDEDGVRCLQRTGGLYDGLTEFGGYLTKISEGSAALQEGAKALEDGLGTLNENKVSLEEGADSLTLGSAELNNGFSEVLSGVKSLKEGVEKFDREGIQKLEKLAGQELRNVVQRLRVLRETDGTWNRFSGDSDKDVSLKIVLETEGI